MENKTDKDNISLIQKTLDSGTYSQIRRMLNKLQAADIAHFIESSPPEERDFVWKILDKEIADEISYRFENEMKELEYL